MNTDIRLDVTLLSHRKFRRFRHCVGDRALEYLVSLWVQVAIQRPSGDLSGWDALDLAEACGYAAGDVEQFASHLIECGWIDQSEDGLVVHDWGVHQPYVTKAPERRARAREAGSLGGKRSAETRAERYGTAQPSKRPRSDRFDGPEATAPEASEAPSPSPSPSPRSKPKTSSSSASPTDAPTSTPAAPPKAPKEPPGFAEFWELYPRKVGKGAARKAWERARKRCNGSRDLLTLCQEALPKHLRSEQWTRDGGQFVPHPATWLNQDRWEDATEEDDLARDEEAFRAKLRAAREKQAAQLRELGGGTLEAD